MEPFYEEYMNSMKHSVLYYSVGPLLYCPANHTGIAGSLIQERFGKQFSLALCLEDTIADDHVEEAEARLTQTLTDLWTASGKKIFSFPKSLSESGVQDRYQDLWHFWEKQTR